MKKSTFFLISVIILTIFAPARGQYITLKEKQFYDQNGDPFYPLICNYVMELAYDPINNPLHNPLQSSDFVIHPQANYGTTHGFDDINGTTLSDGFERIRADFIKIKDMGFNTIRIMGLDIQKLNGASEGGLFRARIWPNPQKFEVDPVFKIPVTDYSIRCTAPYTTNSNFQNIISVYINQIMELAEDADINIIFVCGRSYLSNNDENAADYAAYLAAIADLCKNRTKLFAYDLDNEPGWGIWGTETQYRTATKNKICTYTNLWYDFIKGKDTNHLITINNTTVTTDIFSWDPSIMKVDFSAYHLYPFIESYPWMYSNTYSAANSNATRNMAIGKIESEMHWLYRNCPVPWMIGEIGAAAHQALENNPVEYCYTGPPNVNISIIPWVWGGFNDQTNFAITTQQRTINQEGSGYSWWSFQESLWPDCYGAPYAFKTKYIDLLSPGNPIFNSGSRTFSYMGNQFEKPLVDDAFGENSIFQATSPPLMPANYYNPIGGNSSTNYTIRGTIKDNSGNPVSDAVIVGWNHDDNHFVPDERNRYSVFTFSHDDGTFELIAPIGHISNNDPINPIDFSKFAGVTYSAPGASVATINGSVLPALPQGGSNIYQLPSNQTPVLTRNTGVFDKSISNITVSNGQSPAPFTARHILTTQNITVETGGMADFHASMEVNMLPGFEAESGSETFIYIAPVDFECSQMLSPAYKTGETKMLRAETGDKSIEVGYRLLPSFFRLYPNPAGEMLYLEADEPGNAFVEITSCSGNVVYSGEIFIDRTAGLSLSRFSSGCYFVRISALDKNEIFKLIITKN